MNNNETNSVEEIIDLTDVVSVGNAGENADAPRVEDDVLDSLVSDFEKNIGAVSAPAAGAENTENEENDEPLDLGKLDSLINSYNLDFDADENNQGDNQEEIDSGMDVAFVEDEQHQTMQAGFDENTVFNSQSPDNSPTDDIDDKDIPSFEDIDLPSLEDEQDTEIDLLTKDIIDGTNSEKNTNAQENIDTDTIQVGDDSPFSAMLNEELGQQEKSRPIQQAKPASAQKAPEMPQDMLDDEELKSDMADEAEEINEDVFNDILTELSLEHETDEEVVPFAKEASSDTKPIHLKGDVSFIEAQEKDKSEDIHLVQSASKVLASDEAYLEKFSGEDDSVGAKIKNISTKMFSLEQRLIAADSKVQDSMLELNYRINGLETKQSEVQEAIEAKLAAIKSENASMPAEEKTEQKNSESLVALTEKVQALEKRIATLDDIFSEQKMLNDELSKNLDNLMQSVGSQNAGSADAGHVQALEEKIAVLESELSSAQAKIANLEENLEKAASLAAAKVLREEIIPLLGQ